MSDTTFDGHDDIGDVGAMGTVSSAGGAYRVSGSGHNMWFDRDAFHLVWKRVSGDMSLSALVDFVGEGADPHRKAALMIRSSLEPDAVYADISLHGDGLTSLQFRREIGGTTREIQSDRSGGRLEIRRCGRTVSAFLDGSPSGGSALLDLPDEYYIGLAVCSHVHGVLETAVFSEIELARLDGATPRLFSTIETIDIASTDRRVVSVVERLVEAPNWTPDDHLIVNGDGRLFRIPVTGGELTSIDTGFATACNNDHGLSHDGTRIAISDQSGDGRSLVHVLPIEGGAPELVTSEGPSYWHGWSPDGFTITFCGQRDDSFGIFTIPADGSGEETRITTAVGLDDGPEYSPDGQWILFNSDRTGLMQIHRVRPDGSELERVVHSGTSDWFPHVSPDGRWMVHLAFEPDVVGHPRDQEVSLVLTDLRTGRDSVVADLFGGQGTINVPSWSPDGTRFAFVSYQYV